MLEQKADIGQPQAMYLVRARQYNLEAFAPAGRRIRMPALSERFLQRGLIDFPA
jgi:hypothetical protein